MGAAEKRIETPWLTTVEAAEYLRTTPGAVLKLVARGRLTPDSYGRTGKGRTHMFSRETLDKFLKGG